MKNVCFSIAALLLFAQTVFADRRAVVETEVTLQAEPNAESAAVATVRTNKSFEFTCESADDWCKATLDGGTVGWLPLESIRLHFTTKDLPGPDEEGSEIDEVAHRRGLNYSLTTKRAVRGDRKALKQFFAMAKDVDGAAAESYHGMPTVVYHLLGDEKFAQFVRAQPLADQVMIRNWILGDGLPLPATDYLRRHFPLTTNELFRGEMVGWFSPDGRYAIRKTFSDPFDLSASKVTRAELIEKASGRVLADLTSDDIGTGWEQEGDVLWAPDSKRFAYRSNRENQEQANLFSTPRPEPHRKVTAIYQLTGDSWQRADLLPNEPPDRADDAELAGGVLGHEYTEPVRWEKPNVLVLERHDYYEVMRPIEGSEIQSINGAGRLYRITATITPDGKANAIWKLRKNP
jgi:hypothetical protein